MKKLLPIILMCAMGQAQAGVIAFDDAYSSFGNGNKATNYYVASDGMTIAGTYFGLVGGIGNGDPGNWNLAGTNGSAFLGCNSGSACSPTFMFSSILSNFSLDVGMPGFGWSGTITLYALLNNVEVDSDAVSITSPSEPGNWASLSAAGVFDSVSVTFLSTGGNSFGFGIDNINYSADRQNVPEPATILLMGIALAGLGVNRRIQRKFA